MTSHPVIALEILICLMESMAVLTLFYRLYPPTSKWRRVAVPVFALLSSAVWVLSLANYDANRNDLLLLGILVALVLLNGDLRGSLLAAAFYRGICCGVDYFLADCFMLLGRIPWHENMYGVDMYLYRLILEIASVLWANLYYRIMRKFHGKLPNVIYIPLVVMIPVLAQALTAFSNYAVAQNEETPMYMYIFGAVFNALLVTVYTVILAVYTKLTMKANNVQPVWTKEAGLSDAFTRKFSISRREGEIISLLLLGKTNKEIAAALYISVETIKTHTRNIYRKTGVSGRFALQSLLCS